MTTAILAAAGVHEIPEGWELPRSIFALQRFTFALELHWQATLPPQPPRAAAGTAAQALPGGSVLAELIAIESPTRRDIAALAEVLGRAGGNEAGRPSHPAAHLARAIGAILASLLDESTPI